MRPLLQLLVLEPELLGQDPGVGLLAHHAIQSQPAAASLARELPTGQDRLHRWGKF